MRNPNPALIHRALLAASLLAFAAPVGFAAPRTTTKEGDVSSPGSVSMEFVTKYRDNVLSLARTHQEARQAHSVFLDAVKYAPDADQSLGASVLGESEQSLLSAISVVNMALVYGEMKWDVDRAVVLAKLVEESRMASSLLETDIKSIALYVSRMKSPALIAETQRLRGAIENEATSSAITVAAAIDSTSVVVSWTSLPDTSTRTPRMSARSAHKRWT